MLHTKFHGNRQAGSGDDFEGFLPYMGVVAILVMFVWVESLCPSQQFFSHVGTEPSLPGYYQYFLGGKCILLKGKTRRPG